MISIQPMNGSGLALGIPGKMKNENKDRQEDNWPKSG